MTRPLPHEKGGLFQLLRRAEIRDKCTLGYGQDREALATPSEGKRGSIRIYIIIYIVERLNTQTNNGYYAAARQHARDEHF